MPNTAGNDAPYVIGAIEDAATAQYPGLTYHSHVPGFGGDKVNPVVVNDDGTFLAAFQVSAPVYLKEFFSQSSSMGKAGFEVLSGVAKEYHFYSMTPGSSGAVTYTLSGVDAANEPLQIMLIPAEDGRIVITETILANFTVGSSPKLQLSGLAPNSQYSGYLVLENSDAFDSAAPTTTAEVTGSIGFLSLNSPPAGQSSLQYGNYIQSPVGLVESFSLTNTAAWETSTTTFKLVFDTQEPLDLTGFSGVILQDGERPGGDHRTVLLVTPVNDVIAVPPTILQQLEARPGSVSLFVGGFVFGGQPPQAQIAVQLPVTTVEEGLYVQQFAANGVPLAEAVRVDEPDNAIISDIGGEGFTVSRSADGGLVAAWLGDTASVAEAVYVRKLDDTGNPVGDAVTLSGVDSVVLGLLTDGNGSAVLTGLADGGFAIAYTVEPWFSGVHLSGKTTAGSLTLSGVDGQLEKVYLHQFVAAGAITAQVRGEKANGSQLSVNVTIADGVFQMTDAVRGQFAPDAHLSLFIGGLTPNTDYGASVTTRDVFEFGETSTLGTVSRSAIAGNATGANPNIYFSTGQGETLSFKINAVTAEAGSTPAYTISLITAKPLDLTGLTQYTGPTIAGRMASTANTSIGFNVFLNTIVVTPVAGTVTVPDAILSQVDDDGFRSVLGISGLETGTAANVDIGIRHPSHISVPGLYTQTFDADGEAATTAQRIDDADAGLPTAAPLDDDAALGISANADGGFRVSWLTTTDIEGDSGRIISREFDTHGVAVGTSIDLSATDIAGVLPAIAAGAHVTVPDEMHLVELGDGRFAALVQIDAQDVWESVNILAYVPPNTTGSAYFSPLQGQLDSVEISLSSQIGAALAAQPRAGYVSGIGLDGKALQVPVTIVDGRFKMSDDIRSQFAADEKLALAVPGVTNPIAPSSTGSFALFPAFIGSKDVFTFDESSSTVSINTATTVLNNLAPFAGNPDAFFSSGVGRTVAFQVNAMTAGVNETPDYALLILSERPIDPSGLNVYSGAGAAPFYLSSVNNSSVTGQYTTTITVTPTNGRIEVPQALLDQFPHGGLSASLLVRGLAAGTPANVDVIVQQPAHVLTEGLFVQLLDSTGKPTGDLIRIDEPANRVVDAEDHSQSSIQSDGAGGFHVVWQSNVDADEDVDAIVIRHFGADGQPLGEAISVDSIPDRIYSKGAPVLLYTSGIFADPDPNDTLTFSATGLPTNLSINPATGVISGFASNAGLFTVTVTATDSGGLSASSSFEILNLGANAAPTAVSFANVVATTPENGKSTKVADIVVTDDGLGTNQLALTGTDANAFSIINGALFFNGSANFETLAAYDVTVTAKDIVLADTAVSQNFHLAIGDVIEGQNFAGTAGDDTLTVNPLSLDRWMVAGLQGNDLLATGNGVDNINGGAGNDTISGGGGNDTILGSAGADTINGGAGDDVISGGMDGDFLLGDEGNDQISGNDGSDTLGGGAGIDTLTGGLSVDFFRGTAAELAGDTITDFSVDDQIIITDVSAASFTFSVVGTTLNYTGGTLTLSNLPNARLAASVNPAGGVALRLIENKAPDDFNGDGRSDILWRNADGTITSWHGRLDGGFIDVSSVVAKQVALGWTIAATGDFNGDARTDILWRNINGSLTSWVGTATDAFADISANAAAQVATSWHVADTGDFNGDGRDDILWRNDNGSMTSWLGTSTGRFSDNSANASANVANSWHIAGTGDFNGDGRDDILWRNNDGSLSNWLGTATGGFADNGAVSGTNVDASWNVVGIGDFNGDARADILWRNDNSSLTNWLRTATGGYSDNSAIAATFVNTALSVANVGDYNGDGRSDILWRHSDGGLKNWLGTSSGAFINNSDNSSNEIPSNFKAAGLGDFNGDGKSDILWRSTSAITDWLGAAGGRLVENNANAQAAVSGDWHVTGTGDFNGDGRDDILWRNDNGALSDWLGTAAGGFADNGGVSGAIVATSWHVTGTGDFNGDGRDDILWRHENGSLSEWLGTATGGFVDNGGKAGTQVATSWRVAGTGDFNGDGRDDILWRNDNGSLSTWLGTTIGAFADNGGNAGAYVATSWHVEGTGDFNGDGRDDILWRNDDGSMSDWLGTTTGGFADNGGAAGASVSKSWHIDGTGDFNGDGRDDILWRNDDGRMFNWLGTQSGAFVKNDANSLAYPPLDWEVQVVEHFLI